MKEVLLCKYGEIILKGANRRYFEDLLLRQLKQKAKSHGPFNIYKAQSTVYVEPLDGEADMDGMLADACKVFGIISIARAAVCEKNMESICQTLRACMPDALRGVRTFKVEAKRADKRFPLDSMEIAAEAGAAVLEAVPGLRVDVHHPEVTVRVEVRESAAYVHAGCIKGAGGMPVGSNGRGLLLLSGGIDSPVAGYMMAKRGMTIEAIHFESAPYTSPMALDKVLRLARLVAEYNQDEMIVHVASLTHIQEELVRSCEEDYFTLLLRRYMMAIADRCAARCHCEALVTGESLGQVASQTAEAMAVTNPLASRPVFRPAIGLDKEEIVEIARRIGTFDTSIEPFEDCCTVFTPRHPRTRPELAKVLAQEEKLDFAALVNEAVAGMHRIVVHPGQEIHIP
jgi:thiamine biosynthesis protein ThiI